MLTPFIPDDNCTKDTFTFVKELNQVSANNSLMISYDVVSLFTNVPLSETIDIAVNLIFENKPELKISRKELKKLFEFATSKTHFFV